MTKKIGLALGGGAALGWAHIGAIRVLQKNDINIDCVAGTSIGAMVGGCYAADRLDILEDIARQMNWRRMIAMADVQVGKNGFLGGGPVVKQLKAHLGDLKIEDLSKPFCAVATDLISGSEHVFQSGDIVQAIRASISLPGVFTPIPFEDKLLIDGGLVNVVPVSASRALGADIVIGINVTGDYEGQAQAAGLLDWTNPNSAIASMPNPSDGRLTRSRKALSKFFRKKDPQPSFMNVAMTSAALMMRENAHIKNQLCPADIYVTPQVGHITQIEFDKADELIELGAAAMEQAIPKVKAQQIG